MRLPLAVWGNRLGKAAIIAVVAGAIGGTGWLAGHGAASPEPVAEDLPPVDMSPKVITVGTGSVVNRLTVGATVQADPPVQVYAQKGGAVTQIYRKAGKTVRKGDAILAVRSLPEGADQLPPGSGGGSESGSGSGSQPAKPAKPVTRVIYATTSGRISALPAPIGKEVAPGDPVASIDRRLFRAVASIEAGEVYRLYNKPKSIKLAIDHGPAPFACRLLAYGAGAGGVGTGRSGGDTDAGPGAPGDLAGGEPGSEGGSAGGGVEVSCRVPVSQRVFAGVQAKMSITTDEVEDAVVVPLSAVLGQADKGRVAVVGPDGEHTVRQVRLGINDGSKVEVLSGLREGEKILDRAPEDPAFSGPSGPEDGGEEPGEMVVVP